MRPVIAVILTCLALAACGTTEHKTVIVNPPSNLPVRTGTLFTSAGVCWTNTQVLPIQMVCH